MRKTILILLALLVLMSVAIPVSAAPQKPVITDTSPDTEGCLGGFGVETWVEVEKPASGELHYLWYRSDTEDLAMLTPLANASEACYRLPEPDEPCVAWYLCQVWVSENGENSQTTFSRPIRVEYKAPEMEIVSPPKKLVYTSGEKLDLTGMHVRLYVDNGYVDLYNGDKLDITKNPLTTVGEQKIAVRFKGAFDVFIVTVKEAPTHTTHTFSNWMVTAEPTCSQVGQRVRECECGVTEKEDIPALEHAWDEGSKTDEGMLYTCTLCKETKTEEVKENATTPNKRPGKNTNDSDKTDKEVDEDENDKESVPVWALVLIGVAAMAVGGFLALLVLNRKPKKRARPSGPV